jgi:hypothetical protein
MYYNGALLSLEIQRGDGLPGQPQPRGDHQNPACENYTPELDVECLRIEVAVLMRFSSVDP